ncbi:MAG TPA: DNA alkylation repair protein [Gaiellaceae bacterium]|nr:DNA alkylation repair protein [Gaiellaceae bacterium]
MPSAPTPDRELVDHVRAALGRRGDPEKAEPMRAYMKSELPFLGVQAPGQRAAFREAFAEHALPDFATWRDTVLALWRGARHREERYAAIALTGERRYRAYALDLRALPLYEELIVDGAWWDLVDGVAVHRLGPLLREHPDELRRTLLDWSRSDDIWKRRSAIIAQNALEEATDAGLLYACIEASLGRKELFLRKAIGWALRERARTDPDEVARYVREREADLAPLSRREALKHLGV